MEQDKSLNTEIEDGKGVVKQQTEHGSIQDSKTNTETKDETIVLTKSDLDRKITEATFKAIENQKKKAEKEVLKAKGDYESLANQYKSELEELKAEKAKAEFHSKLTQLASEKKLADYLYMFEPYTDIESAAEAMDKFSAVIEEAVTKKLAEKLTVNAPTPSMGSILPKKGEDYTPEEWAAYKKSKGLI